MGCDIHPVLEKKVKFKDGTEKWVGLHDFALGSRYESWQDQKGTWRIKVSGHNWVPAFDARNYERFAQLAGVRGDGPAPKGIPEDASDMSRMLFEGWEGDGHSHSWTPLREALEICLATEFDSARVFLDDTDPRKKDPLDYYFGIRYFGDDENDSMDNYRVVYCFDN